MNKIELFAFDLDGTLLDTAPDFYKSVNILRQKYDLDTITKARTPNKDLVKSQFT